MRFTRYLSTGNALGVIELEASDKGLCSLRFLDAKPDDVKPDDAVDSPESVHLQKAASWIKAWLSGEKLPPAPKLDLAGTDFQKRVWKVLSKTRRGSTTTYGELAEKAGSPLAARAVGQAMSKNPVPLIVPCHRVLASNARLGGFTGGLDRKRLMLRHEGANWNEG